MKKLLAATLLAWLPAVVCAEVRFLNPWEGLRDYDSMPAFTNHDAAIVQKLRVAVQNAKPALQGCNAGKVKVQKGWIVRLTSNVCERAKRDEMLKLLAALAPALAENTTLRLASFKSSDTPDLVVIHYDIHADQQVPDNGYPFLSLWRLRFTSSNTYEAPYAGGFLNGSIHTIRNFGVSTKEQVLFVKHFSCIECEPTIYLTAIDFTTGAVPFQFTYSTNHSEFAPTIEYELPGMGHTVDAKVETRTLPPSLGGPHLLQSFKMGKEEKRPSEWWAFTCKDHRCDYEMHLDKAPASFRELWHKGKRL